MGDDMKSIKFALMCIKKNLKNEKELKGAFFTSIIGMCINNIAFIVLWYNFGKLVGTLNGYLLQVKYDNVIRAIVCVTSTSALTLFPY